MPWRFGRRPPLWPNAPSQAERLLAIDECERAQAKLHGLLAERDIGARVEVVAECEVLVDGLDPVPRAPRRQALHLLLADPQLSGIGIVDSARDLDDGALSGPVVADQTEDLARIDVERDASQGLDASEPFRDLAAADDRPGGDPFVGNHGRSEKRERVALPLRDPSHEEDGSHLMSSMDCPLFNGFLL